MKKGKNRCSDQDSALYVEASLLIREIFGKERAVRYLERKHVDRTIAERVHEAGLRRGAGPPLPPACC